MSSACAWGGKLMWLALNVIHSTHNHDLFKFISCTFYIVDRQLVWLFVSNWYEYQYFQQPRQTMHWVHWGYIFIFTVWFNTLLIQFIVCNLKKNYSGFDLKKYCWKETITWYETTVSRQYCNNSKWRWNITIQYNVN